MIIFSLFNYLFENFLNYLQINRFRDNLIHLMSPCFLYILFFSMSSTSYNHRLQNIFLSQKASYFLTSLIPINNRHRAVHKYQAKTIVLLKSILYKLYGFVTIKCLLNDFRNIFITSLHQNNF